MNGAHRSIIIYSSIMELVLASLCIMKNHTQVGFIVE